MNKFENADQILDFAISNEEEAIKFYSELAGKLNNPQTKAIFETFISEEKKHKEKLLQAKQNKIFMNSGEKVADLKISDYLVDVVPGTKMNYQSALILAMKKEKQAFRLYMDLSEKSDGELKDMFIALAQEEAKHKLRLELEYDENILKED
jgi:rubrerythrin